MVLFPNAKIIYDRFHVMAIINDELNKLRKLFNLLPMIAVLSDLFLVPSLPTIF